jgi:hypothetical protein
MAVAHTFEHVSGGERFGKKLYAGSATIEPGILVRLASGSLLGIASASDAPFGFAYGLRYSPYRPTSKFFAAGEELAVVHGVGKVLASPEFFIAGTAPADNSLLYSAAGGLMDVTGTFKVGRVIRTEVRVDPSGGTGTNQNVTLIQMNLPVM